MSDGALQRGRGFRKVFFLLVLLHMAPCHSLPRKESCEMRAEHGRYQIGESLTKNTRTHTRASLPGTPTRYVGNKNALDAGGDAMISYIPNSIKTSPPRALLIRNA